MAGGKEWRCFIGWKFPYKAHTLSDPEYIKDRDRMFKKNGNGWWWNDGRGWSMNWETHMLYQRRRRKEKGLE